MRHALRLLVAGLLAVVPAAAAAQRAPGPAPELTRIEFEGVTRFPVDSVAAAVFNRGSECRIPPPLSAVCLVGIARDRHYFAPAELRADSVRIVLYYYQRGYRSAQVRATVDEGAEGVRLRFLVEEGPPLVVQSLAVAGLPPGIDAPRLPLRLGQPFALARYEESGDSLEAVLREHGYAHAVVFPGAMIPRDSGIARVTYDVDAGPRARFGPVRVVGASLVDTATVRGMLSFAAGDLYRESELALSQRNLFAVDLFRHAQVTPDSAAVAARADTVPIVVQVNEGDPHRVRIGVGLDTEECANAEGRLASRNLFGGARRLELRARIANVLADRVREFPCHNTGSGIYGELTGSLNADFTQPAFLTAGQTLGAGAFLERRTVPDVYVRSSRGAYVSLTRAPGARSSFTLGFRPELTGLEAENDRDFCDYFDICRSDDIPLLRDPHWLSPVIASFVRDRSNSIFSPSAGFIVRVEGEYASRVTGSDFAYTRLLGELSAYRAVGDGVVLATRVRPGWAHVIDEPGRVGLGLHPQKRFFGGGPNSVRGFAQYRMGPKVLSIEPDRLVLPVDEGGAGCTIAAVNDGSCDANAIADGAFSPRAVGGAAMLEASVELRFPLALEDRLRGAAFVDVGQVWRDVAEARIDDLVLTPGFGVRYFSPAGPIRVDLGYNAQGAELQRVLTTGLADAEGSLVALERAVVWAPRDRFVDRLQLHFSIGQAF